MWVQSGFGLWLCLSAFWRVHWVQACQLSGLSAPFVGCPRFRGAFPASHRGIFSAGSGKKWQKLDFICSSWCFLGDLRYRKGRKAKIYLKSGVCVWGLVSLWWWCSIVSTCVGVQDLSRLQDLPEVGSGPLVVCSLLLSAFLLCLWCAMLEYGSISRFKGVFSAV